MVEATLRESNPQVGYNRFMFRAIRIATAAVVGLAIAVLPVVLDQCTGTCEAHRNTIASTPACHHATSAGTHIAQVPTPCGHDHNVAAVTAVKSPTPTGRAFDSIVAVDSQPALASPTDTADRVRPHSPPGFSLTPDRRSLPLRV
jgi:hypothetical protein